MTKEELIQRLESYSAAATQVKARLEDLQTRLNATYKVVDRLNLETQYLLNALKEK